MKKILLLITVATLSLYSETFNVSTTPELRTALNNAASNGQDDTIIIADGTYKTTDDGLGTFVFLDNEAYTLTLIGSSSENVILSGDNQNQVFNHDSTQNAILKLEKLSIVHGNTYNATTTNELHNGGGIYTDYNIEIIDCNFMDNNASYDGGGFFASGYAYVTNSNFERNKNAGFHSVGASVINSTFTGNTRSSTVYRGAGFYSTRTTIVTNSSFTGNIGNMEGGGFFSLDCSTISNSTFYNNIALRGGGFQSSCPTITNSIFTNNSATEGGGFYGSSIKASNLLFINNSDGISISSGEDNIIINSIFDNNNSDIITPTNYTPIISQLDNNYLDVSKVTVQNFKANNIFSGVNLGFVDEVNGDYNLTILSDLIDAGTIDVVGVTFPTTDLNGDFRLAGGNIDIGPYEFSTTRPTINSVTYGGIAQELSELTFNVDYTLTSNRTISTIEYDYLNDGGYTTSNIYTYNSAGTYTVNVKVTDNSGEFSTTSKTISIIELPYSEMTYEQKLLKTIDPIYYDDIISLIEVDKNSAVDVATTNAIETGKQYVQDNLSEFDLVTKSSVELNTTTISGFTAGWSLISTPFEITDLSIFDSASIVWIYNNTTSSWSAYSSDTTMSQQIQDNSEINSINTIPAGSGIWVNK